MAGRNRFFDSDMFKTEQELMVEEIERQQALDCEAELQMEHLDRLLELRGLLESGVTFNPGVRYSVEQHMGYIPETLELAQEGIIDTIWEGIKAFFKAIGKFISELFTGKSKSSSDKVDSYLNKVKEFESKYGEALRQKQDEWYPDQFKATSAKALKTFPDDAKLKSAIEQLDRQYNSGRFDKTCAHLSLMPELPIYGKVNSITTAILSGMPKFDTFAEIMEMGRSGGHRGVDLYQPLKLKEALPLPIYDTYIELFKRSGQSVPDLLGDVTESMMKSALDESLVKQKLDSYRSLFNRSGRSHATELMKDYQQWIDRTGKDLPKVKQNVDKMISKLDVNTDPKLASSIRQLGKDINGQMVTCNFLYDILNRMVDGSSYLLDVESKIMDISLYVQDLALKNRPN